MPLFTKILPFFLLIVSGIHAQRTWQAQNIVMESGAQIVGTFDYNSVTEIISNVNLSLFNSDAHGNISFVFGQPVKIDPFGPPIGFTFFPDTNVVSFTGETALTLEFQGTMTNNGGSLEIRTQFGGLGQCSDPNCEVFSNNGFEPGYRSGYVTTDPIWHLQNVIFNTGASATGTFIYAPATNSYWGIDIEVIGSPQNGLNGFTSYSVTNPNNQGNNSFLFAVTSDQADLTGANGLILQYANILTIQGGTIPLLGNTNSYQGVCSNAVCAPINPPFDDVVSGSITTIDPNEYCAEGLTITSPHEVDGVFSTNKIIASIADIENGLQVTYEAGETITLTGGFHAKTGSTFTAKIQACNACSATASTRMPTVFAERQYNKEEKQWNLYPNPVDRGRPLSFYQQGKGLVSIHLINNIGQTITTLARQEFVDAGWHTIDLPAAGLSPGYYYLTFQSPERLITQKLVVK